MFSYSNEKGEDLMAKYHRGIKKSESISMSARKDQPRRMVIVPLATKTELVQRALPKTDTGLWGLRFAVGHGFIACI